MKNFKKWFSSTVEGIWQGAEQVCRHDGIINGHLFILSDAIRDAGKDDEDWAYAEKMQWIGEKGRKQQFA